MWRRQRRVVVGHAGVGGERKIAGGAPQQEQVSAGDVVACSVIDRGPVQVGVGKRQLAVARCRHLVAEEQLGGAQDEGVGFLGQKPAEDQMDELLDEDRRHARSIRAKQGEIAGLDGAVPQEMVAIGQQHAVIVRRVGIGERRQIGLGDRRVGRLHQPLEQPMLVVAAFLDRVDFRPGVVGAQEIRRNREPAIVQLVGQVQAGGFPDDTALWREGFRRHLHQESAPLAASVRGSSTVRPSVFNRAPPASSRPIMVPDCRTPPRTMSTVSPIASARDVQL